MITISQVNRIEAEADKYSIIFASTETSRKTLFRQKFAALLAKEIAKEMRKVEKEADRAFQVGETSERQIFNGNDFADMLEEAFGV